MKKQWLNSCLVLFLVTGFSASAQTTPPKENRFSVKQAVDYGTKNATAVKNALIDIQIQKQTNREITAAAFPQVSGSINTTHYFNTPVQPIPDFISYQIYDALEKKGVKDGQGNPITNPKNFPDLPFSVVRPWSAGASLDVSQLLFDGQVFVGLQARNASIDFVTKNAEVTQEMIKANIYKIYYQLVVGQKQMSTIDINIERLQKLLHDVNVLFDNGFTEKLSIDRTQVQLNNLQTEKLKLTNILESGNEGLKFLMNMPQNEKLILTDTLSDADLKSGLLEEAYDYKNRKEFQLLSTAEKLNTYNVKRYQLSRIPTVALFGSYQKNAQRDEFDFFEKGDWFTTSLIGLKVNVPIFDGNARRARIEKAKLDLSKTRNNIEQLKQNIDYDVNASRIKIKNAILTLDNQKKNIALAEKVYRTTKLKYEQGLGGNDELYNADADLRVAQTNYYNALYDAITAKIDYLKATGRL